MLLFAVVIADHAVIPTDFYLASRKLKARRVSFEKGNCQDEAEWRKVGRGEAWPESFR